MLPDYGAESVKSIGDAILIRAPEPAPAIRLGTRIAHGLMTAHGAPSVRVGMHYGPAIERDGDYFGAAVNLAARVSSVATGGEVLLTSTTGALAGDLDDIVYEPRGRHRLRNIREPVELLAALMVGAPGREGLVVDPVCRMVIDPERAVGRLTHEGLMHFFCTLECAGQFARDRILLRAERRATAPGGLAASHSATTGSSGWSRFLEAIRDLADRRVRGRIVIAVTP